MNIEEIEKNFLEYINTNNVFSTKFGEIELNKSDRIGQGGNGLVYSAIINKKEVAVKFLISNSESKISMAQIMYWYVFGTINRGTGAKCISQKYKWKNAYIYDEVINKSLRNEPSERFQSVDEIIKFIDDETHKSKEIDIFEDMRKFHRAILSVVPEFYNHPFVIKDKSIMCELFNSICNNDYNSSLEFNTGIGNSDIHSIIKLENNEFLMDYNQLNILNVWGFLTDDVYDDILLF